MATIELPIPIAAPIERVFDLARSIDLHVQSMSRSNERAVGGVTSGLIGPGEQVTWEARHFGLRWQLTSRIVAFRRPFHFRDSMVEGPFARFDHDHIFERSNDGTTIMKDRFDYTSPFGVAGRLADATVLRAYLRRLLRARAEAVRHAAESADWKRYLTEV